MMIVVPTRQVALSAPLTRLSLHSPDGLLRPPSLI
jgi:hypothetical protein